MNALPESKLTKRQRRKVGPKMISANERMTVEIRYDDDCGNGHNTFSITAEIHEKRGNKWYESMGGCLHDEVEKHFPEFAPYLKWHLVSSDGPMHYLANTLYHASNLDCWGRALGEVSRVEKSIRFDNVPISHKVGVKFWTWLQEKQQDKDFEYILDKIEHPRESSTFGPKYTFTGFCDKWHDCPFDNETQANEFLAAITSCKVSFVETPVEWSKGKVQDLESARRAAVWSEATDEELTSPDLKEKLIARLPQLLADFQAAMESLGFEY